jgi:hypothetical protein
MTDPPRTPRAIASHPIASRPLRPTSWSACPTASGSRGFTRAGIFATLTPRSERAPGTLRIQRARGEITRITNSDAIDRVVIAF